MWDWRIAGEDLYHIINWFFLYSFLGWVWESCYVSIKEKHLVNRGFVNGPVCTIYGFGAVSVYLILKQVAGNLLLLYLGGVVVPTVLEYLTAALMERIFHTSWWDYSNRKYNLKGRICLEVSLVWGLFTLALFYVLHPFVCWLVSLYPRTVGEIGIQIVIIVYSVDFGMSWMSAMQLAEKLRNLDEVRDELYEYIQSTKLYEETEELRANLASYRTSEYAQELRRRLEDMANAAYAFGPGQAIEEHRERFEERKAELRSQVESRMDTFQNRYNEMKSKGSRMTRRTLNAYPNLKSRSQAMLERTRKKSDEKK